MLMNKVDELPETLPKGTRYSTMYGEFELLESSTFRAEVGGSGYPLVRRRNLSHDVDYPAGNGSLLVDQGNVTLPQLCAACGGPSSSDLRFGLSPADGRGVFAICKPCSRCSYEVVAGAIKDRRATKDSSQVPGSTVGDKPSPTPTAAEKGVATPDDPQGWPSATSQSHSAPREATAARSLDPGSSLSSCRNCGGSRSTGSTGGSSGLCGSCAARVGTCHECSATAVLKGGGRCGYCAYATENGNMDRKFAAALIARAMLNTGAHPNELGARKRLDKWDRAERRRGNPTDRADLAKPHPWSNADD
jgi:hypothetical protein